MNKITLNVPAGIKYLSEWKELWNLLPMNQHYILNKRICGCGATEAYIGSDRKVILASPRKQLIYNKYSQHLSDNLHLYRYQGNREKYFESKSYSEKDVFAFNDELSKYIKSGGKKILTTYDSLRKIKEVLVADGEDLDEWTVVVDEFQAMFYDCQFKPTTEYEFGQILGAFSTVVYLSATPFLESYLDMTRQFKDMTFYELLWPESMMQIPKVEVIKSKKSVFKLCSELTGKYREGKGNSTVVDGKEFVAKEAVFYINDVSVIKNIIKKNGLKADEVNIICSSKSENIKKLNELSRETGEKFMIGDIPGKGEPHKMFTFCTSTVYIGADFYSTNAYSYIFANPLVKSMTVDVSVDLQQIIGRQRLDTNPFRNTATLYFNTRKSKVTEEELENSIKEKKDKTKKQIDNFNAVPNKDEQLQMMENTIRQQGHKEHYCCIIKDADNNVRIVENEILEISERRAWEVTNRIYNNDFSMCRALRVGAVVTKSSGSDDPEVQRIFKEWNLDNQFPRKARLYCDLYDNFPELLEDCTFIEGKYKKYHDALGKEGFEALCWREDYIRQAIEPTPFDKLPKDQIAVKLIDALKTDKTYTKSEVKDLLQGIYKELNIAGKPSASDISEYLTCEDRTVRMKGKLIATFKVTSHFRTKISLFNRITDINHPEEYEIDKVLDIIKTSSYYHVAEKVDAVRKAKTKEEKEKAKMKLPAVTWNGTFKTKNRSGLIHYSSFTALDFDHIQPEKMDEFEKWLQSFLCVYAYYSTPSAKGYKAIILHDNYEPLYHYDLYNQLLKLFDCPEIDKSTTDLARGNFLSYDPNLWKNPKPQPFHFIPSTPEPIIPETVTETIIKDEAGNEMITEDDSYVAKFLNTLSRQVVSDDSIIRILGKIWTGKSIANGRNNTTMSYAGVLCKAGVEKNRAKSFIEELVPDYDITEIIEYAYSHNTFGCERRKYKSRKK
ncbi:BT4734/BF3469 family protein [Phocaeicola vulgatus]|uniref:BT4734/BF3469 family protein n=1 Tax=Phocaeicola vulgatus TaxID=821 RepID=UPI00234D6DE1|nr:BT4734/BF3469 family protein [Phocaeicola vulgatus]MDC7189715.1 BT4734/BF3469 family protein [Phocaeicola vulgatus]